MNIQTVSMKELSSLRIGGEGRMVEIHRYEDLKEVVNYAREKRLLLYIVGEGTNSYFGNNLSRYLFVKLNLKGISFEEGENEKVKVNAFAGEIFDNLIIESINRGLWGLENLSLIPGTVGAAPVQNIGAYGRELCDVFLSLVALNTVSNEIVEIEKGECLFGYRDSIFKKEKGKYIIISITLLLSKKENPVLLYKPLDELKEVKNLTPQIVREKVIKIRTEKLPDWRQHPNAGSFFKNVIVPQKRAEEIRKIYPDIPFIENVDNYKIPTAWLIENVAKMKGLRIEDVGTWPTQPLIIVNYGKATIENINNFTEKIKGIIFEKTGIILEQEVNEII